MWVLCVVLLAGSVLQAQTYYKWTDEQGTIHLTDQPPTGVKGVQERNLVPHATLVNPTTDEEPVVDAGTKASGEQPASGAPRVEIQGYRTTRTGPSSIHASGTVKNIGDGEADDVVVVLSAVDAGQGNPCYESDVTIQPSKLPPGEMAVFDVDVDDPCLLGDAKLDARVRWIGSASLTE